MAQKAKKDRAKSNAATLYKLHVGSALVHATFLLCHTMLKPRSLLGYILVSVPSFICQLTLEKAGRPKHDANGTLKSSGEDLAASGLTEYMFDVVWVTWATLVLVILFGNSLFFVWLLIPAFAAYKGFGLMGTARQMAALQKGGVDPAGAQQQQPAGNRKQRRAA
ncbi:uncharacterized protein PpBr36_05869 [Pyricularia pennisetigena]|uniref:uncharacterized protein n=1 Tax=Pyricularia pennisetigena TaxID=1578925 RepID=UPI0011505BA4|nr:uncharacterized protein PpBr36_05869 [Pyricularia pennisetigena]TLS22961.1 hypothetical protein PpBr36_05869 [Pyricularia pennisetigena]